MGRDRIRKAAAPVRGVISRTISFVEGHRIIATGKCPACDGKWSKAHRKCVPGLFPGETGE